MAAMAAVKDSPPSSSGSSPEASAQQDTGPVQKKKGGRKPVYATQEERKMRNRAAQAAFRERRTEYIKHLEATIKRQEETLASLQQSSRNAADEVLMLRYKNSLLERILLEKGIDVRAELQAYSNNPSQQAAHQQRQLPRPHGAGPQTLAQRAMHGRQLSNSQVRLLPGKVVRRRSIKVRPQQNGPSPPLQPTQVSRTTSPSVSSATVPTPPEHGSTLFAPSLGGTHQPLLPPPQQKFGGMPAVNLQNFYPTPGYQAHMHELDQEYEQELLSAQEADMLEADAEPSPTTAGAFPPILVPTTHAPHMGTLGGAPSHPPGSMYGIPGPFNLDPFDPMIDADPFGLTQSMHFPTPYNNFPAATGNPTR